MSDVDLLRKLKENLALELVNEYPAPAHEAHRMGNVIIRAINRTILALGGNVPDENDD